VKKLFVLMEAEAQTEINLCPFATGTKKYKAHIARQATGGVINPDTLMDPMPLAGLGDSYRPMQTESLYMTTNFSLLDSFTEIDVANHGQVGCWELQSGLGARGVDAVDIETLLTLSGKIEGGNIAINEFAKVIWCPAPYAYQPALTPPPHPHQRPCQYSGASPTPTP